VGSWDGKPDDPEEREDDDPREEDDHPGQCTEDEISSGLYSQAGPGFVHDGPGCIVSDDDFDETWRGRRR
jgi:hypothetical protein